MIPGMIPGFNAPYPWKTPSMKGAGKPTKSSNIQLVSPVAAEDERMRVRGNLRESTVKKKSKKRKSIETKAKQNAKKKRKVNH
jgi:hypothetical protein